MILLLGAAVQECQDPIILDYSVIKASKPKRGKVLSYLYALLLDHIMLWYYSLTSGVEIEQHVSHMMEPTACQLL